ncbi:MAG TPA: DUF4230 domain-containing protein [Gemmatimonadaceae bacterium]|nr:DUF4230 domain-containing protein [Gemmatimonadaceae bacterium]
MPDPILTPAQRRALTWGLIAIALATLAVGGITAVRRIAGGFGLSRPAEPRVDQQIVVERLRSVAKLVATEMTLRDVVTYEQTAFRSTKRSLLVVTARVAAGIDLSHDADVRIDSAEKRITVTLPPAQIMSVDVVNVTTYDERAGLWNPFRPEDRDAIQARIRTQMSTAARQSGILEHADQSAIKVLTELLARDGYTVEVRRPPVVARPMG